MFAILVFLLSANCFIKTANSNAVGNDNVAYAFASSSSDGGNSVISSASATSRAAKVNSSPAAEGSSRVGQGPPVTPRDHDRSPGGSICSANGTLICGSNEVLNECPSYCPSDFCPTGEGQNNQCSEPNPCPTPACKCGFNYSRAQNGTCIPTRQCPPFQCNRPNEVYDPCPPYCPSDDCSQATPTGKCPLPGRIGIVVTCRPACRCRKGYWRNNGVCVPYSECPNKIQCAPGEVVDDCPAACNTDYCPTSENDVRSCFVPKPCLKPACRCPFNYLRAQNGTCILADTCPPIKCTRANEVYASCRPFCPTDDCRQATPSGECPIPEYKDIKAECNPGCTCKKSYWRQNGTCVPFGQCGLDCSGPHEFYACGGACDNVCSELKIQSQDKCPIINIKCNDKCYCEKGYARNEKGICIPIEECPPSCPKNEEYTSDKKKCPSDKCTSLVERCVPSSTGSPGCVCKPGYLRKADGEPCISICDCPQRADSTDCSYPYE